ncbi:MAG: T9SS type A sorting domain-containing protein [Bacteroidales bacterium]|nr:T9SS type A sorting domain-containing protein [Bacteroidales bacterium]
MKKITILLLALFTVGIVSAQRTFNTETNVLSISTESFVQSKINDTLYPPSALLPCFDSLTIYGGTFGYVSGSNSFGDKEKAQRYVNPPAGTISSVLVYALAKSTTGTSSVKIYSVDPTTKKPLTMLGQSSNVDLSAVVVNNVTPYNFTTPVSVTADFAASVVLPTGATDTLVVVSTKNGCYSNDSLTWEMQSDNNWYSFVSQWTSGGVGINIDMVIFPVVQTTVGMTDMSADNLISIYPNPANNFVSVASVNVIEVINLYNALGQIVKSYDVQENVYEVNVSELEKGFYYMQVQTNAGIVSKTLIVQ